MYCTARIDPLCAPIFQHLAYTITYGLYRLHQKHLTVFEIQKPSALLCSASILTVIMHSAVWSLGEMECWLMCVNKCFHSALRRYLISKTVRFSGTLCILHCCISSLVCLCPQYVNSFFLSSQILMQTLLCDLYFAIIHAVLLKCTF
jgi:hypothetical protein